MDDFLDFIAKYWTQIAAVAMASWAIYRGFRADQNTRRLETREEHKQEADDERLHAELFAIAQEAVAGVIKELREELNRLKGELEKVRIMIEEKDGEIAYLKGEVRRWKYLADTYAAKLDEAEIPYVKPEMTMLELKRDRKIGVQELATDDPR